MDIIFTDSQKRAYSKLMEFVTDEEAKIFILKGYAGTGKTTLMRKLVEEMNSRHEPYSLLASTGRAAKILANATGYETHTVHSEIYKFTDLNQDLETVANSREINDVDSTGQLYLNFELTTKSHIGQTKPHYYIIDEASMVSDAVDKNATQAIFGSGQLLSDLFHYDSEGKFIFVGDICQLPPIMQTISPALTPKYIEDNFSIKTYESELTDVVRQSGDNDIAIASQRIRKLYYSPQSWKWAKFPLKGYKNIHLLGNQASLFTQYIKRIEKEGYNSATLIGFSNKQCDVITQIIRPSFGHTAALVKKGDLLLVTQNNLISGLMNGDLVTVEDIIIQEKRAGLTFLKVSVKELFTKRVYSQLMIADIIYSNPKIRKQSQWQSQLQ